MMSNDYQSVAFQRVYMQCRTHIKQKLQQEKGWALHKINRQLFNAIAMLRYECKDAQELWYKSGVVERELDRKYINDFSTEETHYDDFIFSQCCMELAKFHAQGKVNLMEDL